MGKIVSRALNVKAAAVKRLLRMTTIQKPAGLVIPVNSLVHVPLAVSLGKFPLAAVVNQ